jgi:hypothetical protein
MPSRNAAACGAGAPGIQTGWKADLMFLV